MFSIKRNFSEIREKSGFDKLERREKLTVAVGIGFLFCFVILQFGVSPYFKARGKLANSIGKNRSELLELKILQKEYQGFKKQTGGIKEKLKERDPSFSLFSFLDQQAAAADVKELISYMKPSTVESGGDLQESVVEMKLQKISLKQLVDFLKLIESQEKIVSIKRISMQESGQEKGFLEVIMQIVTFVMVNNNG